MEKWETYRSYWVIKTTISLDTICSWEIEWSVTWTDYDLYNEEIWIILNQKNTDLLNG